ncbi:hypothetical protein ACJ41O_002693 [Fusarium nematophilum]
MVFQVHRNIVEPESGWFRDNLPPPNLDGSPVEVHMVCAPEAVAHCLRFIYTRRIEICEYNREQPWNVTHLARCVLAYCAAVYLRAARMASRLLQIVENTSAELGTLVRTEYLHRVLDCAEWVQFSWHYQNAVDILFHETPQKLMRPMKLAMVSIIDAVLFWLIRQPLFLSVIQTTWHGILQTIVVNIAEFRQESRDANPYANSPLPTEAALRNLFAEADGETGGHGKARVGASSNEALVAPEGWATWEEKHRSRQHFEDPISSCLNPRLQQKVKVVLRTSASLMMNITRDLDALIDKTLGFDPELPLTEKLRYPPRDFISAMTAEIGLGRVPRLRPMSQRTDQWMMTRALEEAAGKEVIPTTETTIIAHEVGQGRPIILAMEAQGATGVVLVAHRSFSSDDWEPYDKFSFASQPQSITESSKDGDSDAEPTEAEERALPKDERAKPSLLHPTIVHSSKYTGNAEMGGSHAASLKVVHDPKGNSHPLFRWLHIPQKVLNFDEFWVEISRIHGLTDLEKKAITRIRADVKKICLKSRHNPKGVKVGYLEPKSIEVPLKADLPKSSNTKVTSISSLEAHLDAAERFLAVETTYSNRKAYKSCRGATRKECYGYMKSLADGVEKSASDDVRRSYEVKIDIFNAADVIYTFFLPIAFEDPTSSKFWGAVRSMIELSILNPAYTRASFDTNLSDVRTSLRSFTQDLIAFQDIMAHSTEEERSGLELPPEFSTAWLYVVMGMIYGSRSDFTWKTRISRAKDLVEKGSKKLLQGLSDKSLLDKAAVLPLEVLSLVTLGLLRDQVGKSDDICETYSQYLNFLDNAIMSKPSDRSFQHQLDLLQQELIAIKRTLFKQKGIISRIRNSLTSLDTQEIVMRQFEQSMLMKDKEKQYQKRHHVEAMPQPPPPPPPQSYGPEQDYARADYARVDYAPATTHNPFAPAPPQPANDYMGLDDDFLYDIASSSRLSPTDAGGLRGLLFLECSRLVEQREFEFRRYTEFGKDLERAIAYKMDFTRDRQERAIYAFTIVTIVFLPISTVSSIFGMNTTDVRDMEYSQWLYWVVAVPLTFVVICAGLWFMGELGNLTRWFLRRPGQGVQGIYGGPVMMPQAFESTYWAPPQMPVTEYPSLHGQGMQRTEVPAYYSSPPARVYRRRTMGAGEFS